MSASRITESRRRFVDYISTKSVVSFEELRDALVLRREKKKLVHPGMNLATLYRIIEAFKKSHLIHEVMGDGKRMIVLCQSLESTKQHGITLRVCETCHHVSDTHFSPHPPITRSEVLEYVKSCTQCGK